jgi:hypothetical protein
MITNWLVTWQVFVHNIAGLRTLARGKDWVQKVLIPYSKVLKRGTVMQAEVVDGKSPSSPYPPFTPIYMHSRAKFRRWPSIEVPIHLFLQ